MLMWRRPYGELDEMRGNRCLTAEDHLVPRMVAGEKGQEINVVPTVVAGESARGQGEISR